MWLPTEIFCLSKIERFNLIEVFEHKAHFCPRSSVCPGLLMSFRFCFVSELKLVLQNGLHGPLGLWQLSAELCQQLIEILWGEFESQDGSFPCDRTWGNFSSNFKYMFNKHVLSTYLAHHCAKLKDKYSPCPPVAFKGMLLSGTTASWRSTSFQVWTSFQRKAR